MGDKTAKEGSGRAGIAVRALMSLIIGFAVIGALFFALAGDMAWERAWIYLGTLACLLLVFFAYFLARDPGMLEKRMKRIEERPAQKRYVTLSLFIIVPIFALPGLDRRFGWSEMPAYLAWAGLALVVAGFALIFAVMRANAYASRVIEVQEGQRLIDSGPYAALRHPMYAGNMLVYLGTPLALGSCWALIPAFAYVVILALRIRDEESMLREELPGYEDYCARVRWRLVPGIW